MATRTPLGLAWYSRRRTQTTPVVIKKMITEVGIHPLAWVAATPSGQD